MRRKSERNKSKSTPEKKSGDTSVRKSKRQSRRRKRSTSHSSSEDSDDVPLKSTTADPLETEVSPPSDEPKKSESHSNSDEDKQQEQPIWKVKTSDAPGGEIQKLKICLQRPPTTPERTEKSPRRRRTKASSQSDDAYDEKSHGHGRRKLRRSSPAPHSSDNSAQEIVESAEKDECLIIVKETNEVIMGKGKLDCSQPSQDTESAECLQDSRAEENLPDESLTKSIKQDDNCQPRSSHTPPEQQEHAITATKDTAGAKQDASAADKQLTTPEEKDVEQEQRKVESAPPEPPAEESAETAVTKCPNETDDALRKQDSVPDGNSEKTAAEKTEIPSEPKPAKVVSETEDASEAKDALKVKDVSEVENASKVKDVSEVENASKVKDVSEVENASKVKDVSEVEDASKVKDVSEVEDASKLQDASEAKDAPEKDVSEVEVVPEPTKVEPEAKKEVSEVKDTSETSKDAPEVKDASATSKDAAEVKDASATSKDAAEVKDASATSKDAAEVNDASEANEVPESKDGSKESEDTSKAVEARKNEPEVIEDVSELHKDTSEESKDASELSKDVTEQLIPQKEILDKVEKLSKTEEPSDVMEEAQKTKEASEEETSRSDKEETSKNNKEEISRSDREKSPASGDEKDVVKSEEASEQALKAPQSEATQEEKSSSSVDEPKSLDERKSIAEPFLGESSTEKDVGSKENLRIDDAKSSEVEESGEIEGEKDVESEQKEDKSSDMSTAEETSKTEDFSEDKPVEESTKSSKSSSPETDREPPAEKPTEASDIILPRKRKWGKYRASLLSEDRITLSSIISICPSMKMLTVDELKMDTEEGVKEAKVVKKEREVTIPSVVSPKEDDLEKEVSNIGLNRKISIVNDEASKLQPPPSPPKNPVSPILYITNLVRPFTLKQLKELLSRTGKILDEGFWTDRIKSKCYVQYENEEEAEATRNALHGVQWPIGNGKKLIIDFGSVESMEAAKNATVETPAATAKILPDKTGDKMPDYEKKEIPASDDRWEKARANAPVREWDLGKVPQDHRDRSHSREKMAARSERSEKRRQQRNESPSNGDHVSSRKKKKEEQAEVKLMDDLFHKTKATPSIYWLPLTPEQIAKKQQQRLQRMAEHKRRMEESRRVEREFGRGVPRSRRRSSRYDGD